MRGLRQWGHVLRSSLLDNCVREDREALRAKSWVFLTNLGNPQADGRFVWCEGLASLVGFSGSRKLRV